MFIKGSTKRGQQLLWNHQYSEGESLDDVYTNCSGAKWRGYRRCRELFEESVNHHAFRITSHNTFRFCVAWECEVEYMDPKTGEVTMERITRIETGDNTYMVLLDK